VTEAPPLLEVTDLTVDFGSAPVVDRLSLTMQPGDRVGIIGESGSGKSLTALAILGLAPDSATITGSVRWQGRELLGRSDRELSALRGEAMAMVFQNPLNSLNPVMRVGRQIAEPLRLHHGLSRPAAAAQAIELCRRVGLPDPEHTAQAYPHQLSGGQRQRVGIAIALACRPALLIADEPTTALDVTVQAGVLRLLADLIAARDTALLFITHDVALVSGITDRLLVMRRGAVVEEGPTARLVTTPEHEYTHELIAAARATALHATVPLADGATRG
jgi:peptide/nickel transport system ATP-binding protein